MPLVRYRTGDLMRLRAGSDPIAVAYGVEPFLGVVGRTDDYLVAPDGGGWSHWTTCRGGYATSSECR